MIKFNVDALICPDCDGDYLHHKMVDVMSREKEDDKGVRVKCVGTKTEITSINEIPYRRDVIEIHMECELCGSDNTLQMVQDKGRTRFYWL